MYRIFLFFSFTTIRNPQGGTVDETGSMISVVYVAASSGVLMYRLIFTFNRSIKVLIF